MIGVYHLLWLLSSLPIVTMGAASAALFTAVRELKNGNPSAFKSFRQGFRRHFRQATLIWVPFLILAFLFYLDYQFLAA